MRTSSRLSRPTTRVSTWMPRVAARAASCWPRPVVSLPSEISTIRFCISSGNNAAASRRAPPMSVAAVTGVDRMRSIWRSSSGRRSTRASLPNATTPAVSPSGITARLSRRNASADSRPGVPTESDRSTTNTVARRSTGRTSWKPPRAKTSAATSTVRTTSAALRRTVPMRRRAAMYGTKVISSVGISSSSQSGVSKWMPISRRPARYAAHLAPRLRLGHPAHRSAAGTRATTGWPRPADRRATRP